MALSLPEAIALNPNPLDAYEARIRAWPARRVPLGYVEVVHRGLIIARAFSRDRAELEAFYQPAVLQVERAESLPSMIDALVELDHRHAAAEGAPVPPTARARVVMRQTIKHLRYAFPEAPEVEVVIREANARRGDRSLARSMGRLFEVCRRRWPELHASSRMSAALLEELRALSEALLHWVSLPGEREALADLRRRAVGMVFTEMARVQRLARFALRDQPERRSAYPSLGVGN